MTAANWRMPTELDFILWDCEVEQRTANPAEQDVIVRHLAHVAEDATTALGGTE